MKLPVGYTYDVYLLGEGLDNSQLLLPTGDGFSGKKLILSQSAAQRFHIRIVLKRDQPYQWGVDYTWTPDNARVHNSGKAYTAGGGAFTDFVYQTQ